MPISIVSKLTCKDGKQAEMVLALKAMRTAVQENEPGTTFFLIHKCRRDPLAYYIVEQYADEEAGDAHGKSDAFKNSVELLHKVVDSPPTHFSMDLIV